MRVHVVIIFGSRFAVSGDVSSSTGGECRGALGTVIRDRRAIEVTGTVQGVGFRPFVVQLAAEWQLAGWVKNDGRGVQIEVEGAVDDLDDFVVAVGECAPPLATIRNVVVTSVPLVETAGFEILVSAAAGTGLAAVPPDVAPCQKCLAELGDPRDRRRGYPFTCCTDCGPRYTVVQDLPYDRERTTMAPFDLCRQCRAEYEDPTDRRFHAQAVCCPRCGPQLDLPLDRAIELLRGGAIVAVKGLGGYQLMCRADQSGPVRTLRRRKHRQEKPFAVLVATLDSARRLIELDRLGERALTGPEAPIVLAPVRSGVVAEPSVSASDGADGAGGDDPATVAAEVAPGTGLLGVMLPSTPLHRLLSEGVGVPLVCTSGNLSEEPIAIDDEAAKARLGSIADAFLGHGRTIERRADDSVGQVVHGRFQLLRRARGYAPRPVALGRSGPPVLGVGAELKNTVCLAVGADAAPSVHLGDLENPATLRAFEQAIADQLSLSGTEPRLIVHDLHPEYLSTKFARSQDLAPVLAVQHHHAHLASCLADNRHSGPAIGITFDGLGWGSDGTAWGGEVLIGDAAGFTRAAHLRTVAMPGGGAAAREPWRMAVAHLVSAYGVGDVSGLPSVAALAGDEQALSVVVDLCQQGRSPMTSSMGRLFDAVAALCGIGSVGAAMSYEGQAAIGLEQLAAEAGAEPDAGYRWETEDGEPSVLDPAPVLRAIVEDVAAGVPRATIAARFHRSVADLVSDICHRERDRTGLEVVALTGGVFQNRLLVELIVPRLESAGLTVLRHAQVPPNDGGISLGQVAIGRAHLERNQ